LLARLCKQPAARTQLLVPSGMEVHVGGSRHRVFAVDVFLAALAHGTLSEATREAALRSLLYLTEAADWVLERVGAYRTTVNARAVEPKASATHTATTVTGVGILSSFLVASHRLLAGNAALCLSKLALLPAYLPHMSQGA
jgi:hypothetical protein